MATATIHATERPTVIDNAELTTNWGGNTFALNANLAIQGTNCVECAQTTNGNNDIYVTGTWDFSGSSAGGGDQHIRLPFLITFVGNLAASNAIQMFLYDGTNTSYWYWDKWSSYAGGWTQVVIYTGDTPDVDNSVNMSAITRIGLRFVTSTKPRNVPWNSLFDAWTYGDGYTVYGGSASDPITWADVAAADAIDQFRIVEELDGVLFLRGAIQFGDGTNAVYFSPQGEVCMFTEEQVSSDLYKISFVDDSSGLTDVAIVGGAWSCNSTTLRYAIDASEALINSFTIDGLQVAKAGSISFHAGADVQNCVWDDCGQIDPSTATFKFHRIKNYDDEGASSAATEAALLWPTDDSNISDLTFTDCTLAVEYDVNSDSSPVFHNMIFDDNSGWYDVLNTSGNSATEISLTGTSNANSYIGDYTTFSSSYTHTLTGLVNDSEVTYVERGAAVDTGADGSTTADSRDFVTTNSWVTDEHKGELLYITSGADEGRYYVTGNNATTLFLDTEMGATASSLTWELYDENDDTEEYHVENVTGNQTQYTYGYQANYYVDIIIIHQDYEQVLILEDYKGVHLTNSNKSVPVTQIPDVNYLNP